LGGATVKVNSVTPVISTTTAPNGTYTLTGVPVGTRTVNASATNYVAANSGNITVTQGQTVNAGALALNRTTVTVTGTVKDNATHAALEGARVVVQEQPGRTAWTDGAGAYAIAAVYWGAVHLEVSKDDYSTKTVAVSLTAAGPNAYGILLDSAFGTMTGAVVDTATGFGLVGAHVNLNGDGSFATDTDWEGHYTLTRVPSGLRSLRAVINGYAEGSSGDVEVLPGQQANVSAVRLTPEYAHLTGVVRDGDTGEPVENVVLVSARTGALLVTDQSGTFSSDWLEPGYDVVAFQKDGTSPMVSDPVAIPPGSTTSIELWTRPPCSGPNGTVHGVVRDTAGAPIEGATVTVPGFPSVQTATGGTYSMTVPPGRYVVKAEKSGYRTVLSDHHWDNALFVSTDWQMIQDFALPTVEETATVIISTTDPIQRTPKQGRIWLESLFRFYDVATGPAGESRTIAGVPAGPLLGWLAPRILQPASTTALDFWAWAEAPTTTPRWAAGGLVYRAISGESVSGAVVTLLNASRNYRATATTDGNGRWSFASGLEGEYAVTFAAEGGLTSPDPWTFTAADDGSIFINDVGLVAPGDDGSLTIDEPTTGTLVRHAPLVVRCTATLPKPGDYVLAAEVSLTNTDIKTAPVVYEPDGKHFRVELSEISGEGDQVLTVTAITRTGSFTLGNWPTASIPLTLHLGPSLASLTLNPGELPGGATSLATITLDRPAAAGGMEVSLASGNPAVASVPASVIVAEGASNAEFTVTTLPVSVPAVVEISAASDGITKDATLVVDPPSVASVSLSPSAVAGGQPSTGTVTLDGPAPAGGLTVSLTSSDPAVATVPPAVTVPAEATSVQFAITTSPVSSESVIVISATANGATKTAQLTVGPIGVAALALSPANVVGGQTSTGTITLNAPATAGGLVVSLSSSDPATAPIQATVTVTEGVTSAQFTVTTSVVASTTSVTISANGGGTTRTAPLTVNPLLLQSLTLSPATVTGGQSSTGTLTLNGPAPPGGFTVSLTSADPAVAPVPPSVTVAQGATSTSFTIETSNPSTIKSAVISAVANGSTRTATLTIKPIGVSQFSLAYPKAGGGATVSGTLFLTSVAPAGGTVVSLASDNPAAATVPASITVPGGQHFASIAVKTYPVASPTLVTISATAGSTTRTATLTVGPVNLTEVRLFPTSMAAGLESQSNSIQLDGVAGTGGVTVSLSSSYSYVHVPATVTVPLGSVMADFTLSVWEARCTPVPVVISAVSGSVTKTANFTLQATTLREVSLYRPTVVAGSTATLRVDLNGWENREGCPVVLSSSDNSVAYVWGGLGACQPAGSGFMGDAWFRCPVDVTTSAAAPPGATVTFSATLQGHTDSANLTIAAPAISGVAPGLALPGDTVVVYGPAFAHNSTVMVQGPYELYDPLGMSPSCKVGQVCPTTDLPATVNTEGTALSFAVPAGLQDGAYHLWTKNASGTLSNVNRWFVVDTAAKTSVVVPPDQHNLASRIYPGQTITGTLTGDNAAGGVADFNFFYFVGTAGSRINVSMERVDSSKPWEHPDSLDPQIEIFAPDGFLPQNLVAWDNQPGVDLNASLHDAVLPLTGLYVIAAETTRGHGDYRLSFSFSSLAPPAEGERVFPLSGADRTVPVGSSFETVALTLDPRGYPISGATLAYAAQSSPDNQGTVGFVAGAHALTNPDGSSFKDVVFASAGKAEFGPSFIATFTSEPLAVPEGGPQAVRVKGPIPRYQPVAHLAASVGSLRPDGTITLRIGSFQRLPIERRHVRKELRGSGASGPATGTRPGHPGSGNTSAALLWSQSAATGLGALDPAMEPADASTAIPLPELPRELIARAQGITSCTAATLRAAGTTAAQVNPPYTVTLTDLTPSTGQTEPNGEVGADGIHGHRVEKVIRLRIQIKDKYDVEPTYPVLVHLTTGGPHHGTLILDPDGARKECSNASFLWHERDAQGNLVALNEEFEYRMGTWSRYVGVEPDAGSPGGVKPVWGVAEDLGILLETPDGAPLTFGVHPEPGKPDHFASFDFQGRPEDNRFEYWSDYLVNPVGGGVTAADRHTTWNVYALVDAFGNTNYGYGVTSASSSAPNVTVEFKDQLAEGPDFAAYTMTTWWNDAGGMPEGDVPASLSVTYPGDPDWAGGTVTQAITLVFQRGTFHAVMFYPNYDHHFLWSGGTYGPEDPPFPLSVGPGDSEGVLPKTTAGDTPRFTLLLVTGTNIPNPMGAPWPDPHNLNWSCGGGVCTHEVGTGYDPRLEVTDPGEFRLSLMDGTGNVAKDAQFRVHLCPRYDHEGPVPPVEGYSRACTITPPLSSDGVIESVIPNPQGSSDGRGYLGIELVKAPINPGSYLIYVESKDKTYRIREQSQWFRDFFPDGVYSGGWWLCTVRGAKLLNENFEPVTKTLNIAINRGVYAQEIDPNETQDSYQADIVFQDVDTEYESSLNNVTFWRLGRTAVFQTGLITVISPDQPESPAGELWNASVMQQTMTSLQNSAPAGTIRPYVGRYYVKDRRNRGGSIVFTHLQRAMTRLAEIVSATSNFDGVPAEPGAPPRDQDHIEATVKWGANGWVGLRVVNVDSDAVYTFDFWDTQPLTSDLRGVGGLPVDNTANGIGVQHNTKDQTALFPPAGLGFRAEIPTVGSGVTLKPGLYRLRARWGVNASSAAGTVADPICVTDLPNPTVCDNEWVVSVGQRILLDTDQGGAATLDEKLSEVQSLDPPETRRTWSQFLRDVAAASTAIYADAGANVVVSTDAGLLPPLMKHVLRSSLPMRNECTDFKPSLYMYGCTNNAAEFPLLDPNLELAPDDQHGISITAAYEALAKGPEGWVSHLPIQPARNDQPGLWSPDNPPPTEVFFTRLVNLVTHETAHGFGILSSGPFLKHGFPPTVMQLVAISGLFDPIGRWIELPTPNKMEHEPYACINREKVYPNEWLMQAAPNHWNGLIPGTPWQYDVPAPGETPQFWLVFDRSMWFSKSGEWVERDGADHSLATFFSERIPLCGEPATRSCR
jgi:hypothetical protein